MANKKNQNLKKFKMFQEKIQFSDKNGIYLLLLFVIINIIYISAIIYYLSQIENCPCYQVQNKLNYSNIKYLIFIESIILALNIIILIFMLSSLFLKDKIKSGGGNNLMFIFLLVSLLVYLLVYGYFIYNVYQVYKNTDENCLCTQSWLRYLLYIQAVAMLFGIFSNIFALFN